MGARTAFAGVGLALGVLVALPAAAAPPEDPGFLRNRVQQRLHRGELDAAQEDLEAILRAEPTDGFTHHLLAQLLTYGRNLGPEQEAIYRALADESPGVNTALHAVAELELHRQDKFLGPDSEWLVAAIARLEAIADPPDAAFEAHLARRSLLGLVKQGTEAREAGLAAHAVRPDDLQGRISALSRDRRAGNTAAVLAGCRRLVAEDPWAVEACSMLWAVSVAPGPEATAELEAARAAAIAEVEELQTQVVDDAVTAHEVVKFWQRIGESTRASSLIAALKGRHDGFVPPRRGSWWKRSRMVAQPYRALNVATSKALQLGTADERLEALLPLLGQVPEDGSDDFGVQRYLRALSTTAAEVSGGTRHRRAALERLVRGDPSDAASSFDLARLTAKEPGGADEALRRVRASAAALLATPYDPGAAPLRKTFGDHVESVRSGLQERAALESNLLGRLGGDAVIDAEASFPRGPEAAAWFQRAREANGSNEAIDFLLEGLAGLTEAEAEALSKKDLRPLLPIVRDAFPQIDALRGDARAALLAAGSARRAERRLAADGSGVVGRTVHPFVGQPAPRLHFTDLNDQRVDLADLRGEVVIVDFWATWCGPCRQEMPELVALKAELADLPVRFLMLSIDEEPGVVAPFVDEAGYPLQFGWIGVRGMRQIWQVRGIPSLFVVGPDGVVQNHHQGFRPGLKDRLGAEIRDLLRDR